MVFRTTATLPLVAFFLPALLGGCLLSGPATSSPGPSSPADTGGEADTVDSSSEDIGGDTGTDTVDAGADSGTDTDATADTGSAADTATVPDADSTDSGAADAGSDDTGCPQGGCETCVNGATRSSPDGCGFKVRGTSTQVCKDGRWRDQDCNGVYYRSCKELLAAKPGSGNGWYKLDPDGPSGSAPEESYFCGMKDGGWTQVHAQDFDGMADGWRWRKRPWSEEISGCGKYTSILGGHDVLQTGRLTKRFQLPPVPHGQLRVGLDFIAIDQWELAGNHRDEARLTIEGNVEWRQTFGPALGTPECGDSTGLDGSTRVVKTVAHSTSEFELGVGVVLRGQPVDEFWGIDTLRVWVR